MGRGRGKGPTRDDIIRECEEREILKKGSETRNLTKPELVERLRNVELKVMTWNLADFSTTGVVQGRLWNKEDTTAADIDTKPKKKTFSFPSFVKLSGGTKSSSQAPAPETPACTGRLTLVADTIADEAPDVVFIQEVTTNDKNTAVEELTEKLNKLMKSRKLDVWINAKAVVQKSEHDITYEHTQSEKLKNEGPGGEKYGCVWNTMKFEGKPEVRYLEGADSPDFFEALSVDKDEVKNKILEKLQTLSQVAARAGDSSDGPSTSSSTTFSRFPALFTFTPKHGGPKADNNTKIHFLVFHLASSNPKYGGSAKNEAEMKVLRSLAKHAWKAGSRLILLGDHNAGECGTVSELNKFLKDEHKQITGRFAVDTTGPQSSTNLFPFIKGSASNASDEVADTVKEYLAFLEEQNVNLKDEKLLEYVGDRPKLRDQKKLKKKLEEIMYELGFSDFIHSSGAKHNDNIIIPPERFCRSSANERNKPVGETVDALLKFLEERGVKLRKRNKQTPKYEKEYELQYDSDDQLKTSGVKEALKKIIKDEYLTVDSRRSILDKYVYDLKLLEGRVLEVPATKLLEYTIKHNEPFGSWKYLWSDHRPVVARFSLS